MENTYQSIRIKALVAIAAALVLCAAAFALPQHAQAARAYGQLCSYYESGNDPACIDPNCAYGAYQMDTANAKLFATWMKNHSNTTYQNWGSALSAAYALDGYCGSNFNTTWKYLAGKTFSSGSANAKRLATVAKKTSSGKITAGNATKFWNAQYKYVKKSYYSTALTKWKSALSGFKALDYTVALRNVIFSTAVQHGPSGSVTNVLKPAMKAIGGWKKGLDESKFIAAIYAERSRIASSVSGKSVTLMTKAAALNAGLSTSVAKKLDKKCLVHFYSSSAAVQVGVYNRLGILEPAKAQSLYKTAAASICKHTHTSGGTVTKYYALTDKNHKEKVSAVYCKDCGKLVSKATTRTVANKFVQKGANWKDKSGRKYTVHSKSWYRTTCALTIRAGASVKKSALHVIDEGRYVKVRKAVMGSDGFWWVKIKIDSVTGYVQAQYLQRLGTSSGVHKYKANGVCKYCGKTRTQIANVERIAKSVKKNGALTCTFAQNGSIYSCAYTESNVVKARKKGSKVKIVAVYRNLYYTYWGQTAAGTFVPLHDLK